MKHNILLVLERAHKFRHFVVESTGGNITGPSDMTALLLLETYNASPIAHDAWEIKYNIVAVANVDYSYRGVG